MYVHATVSTEATVGTSSTQQGPIVAMDKVEAAKEHEEKNYQHHRDFDKVREHKAEASGAKRSDRHAGTGHSLNEGPKKGGSGKGNWGSIADEIDEAKQEGLIH